MKYPQAETLYKEALELDPGDAACQGKLALCNGYLNLMQNPRLPKALCCCSVCPAMW